MYCAQIVNVPDDAHSHDPLRSTSSAAIRAAADDICFRRSRPGNLPDPMSAAAPWTGGRRSASPAVYQSNPLLLCAGEQAPLEVQRPAQDR